MCRYFSSFFSTSVDMFSLNKPLPSYYTVFLHNVYKIKSHTNTMFKMYTYFIYKIYHDKYV
ncbi:hypothetical protein DCAR_0626035 [Daucus carota subsp. sativus]|uniref:Uncharacterized protein n=1 Tax=Daucus carota subsp. sativus TaxID=79200 RepID=A0AAF1B7E5_DAUCS|nr:hypothetical protein DCAR_0626035 [Daucus carota subsp. sativus]